MHSSALLLAGILAIFSFAIGISPEKYNTHYRDRQAQHKSALLADSTKEKGRRVYVDNCEVCHKDSNKVKAPGFVAMRIMTPRAVMASLTNGKMRIQGAKLSEDERNAVVLWITNSIVKKTDLPAKAFTDFSLAGNPRSFDHSGWGNNLEGTGFRNAKQAGISKENVATLQLKWAFAFPDATISRSKPAVVGDWLIAGGQFGDVMAINRNTGKLGWNFTAAAAVRGAIAVTKKDSSITAYFADYTTNVYAIDVRTGREIWNKRSGFDALSSVTGSVVVYGGKVYVPISSHEVGSAVDARIDCCFSSGGVVALDAKTGDEVWRYRILPQAKQSAKKKNGKPVYGPSGAPVWCSPTVDAKRGLLYIGTGQNYTYPATLTSDAIQALDLKTGKLVWNFQATKGDMYNVACPYFENCPDVKSPDFDFGMAPILVKRKDGREILVVGQKSGVVYALLPESGKVIWKKKIGKGGKLGGIHWGMATDGNYIYAANADNMIAIDQSDSSWKPQPGIFALNLMNGNLLWKAAAPPCDKQGWLQGNSSAPLVIPGVVFAGSLDGYIRAYDSKDGRVLWDFDTAKEFETVNGIKGRGGAIDGPAPVVAGGMLFVNSGYGMFGQAYGNLLLAFEIKK